MSVVELPKHIIAPPDLCKPRGYSHAVLRELMRGGGGILTHLTISGQTGTDEQGKIKSPGDIAAQTADTLANIRTTMHQIGAPMTSLDRILMFTSNVQAFQAAEHSIGGIWREYFDGYYPATTLIEAARLYDPQAMIELQTEGFVLFDDMQHYDMVVASLNRRS